MPLTAELRVPWPGQATGSLWMAVLGGGGGPVCAGGDQNRGEEARGAAQHGHPRGAGVLAGEAPRPSQGVTLCDAPGPWPLPPRSDEDSVADTRSGWRRAQGSG